MQFEMQQCTYEADFQVFHNLAYDMILGEPFLEKEAAVLDYPRRCLYLGTQQRQTVYWSPMNDTQQIPTKKQLPESIVIPDEHRTFLEPTFTEFADLFSEPTTQATTTTVKHTIRLKDNKPISQRPYPLSPEKTRILYEQLQEMLEKGIIEPSTSAYSSPPVLVERTGKKPRFCIDYRRLNEVTIEETSTLPRIPEVLKSMGEAQYFTTLDLKTGYWQIPLDEASKPFTAFMTPDGATYQFVVMPFGLRNAPSTFQNLMLREILIGHLHDFTQVYLDDVIIYSRTITEHKKHIELVFERLRIHGLKVAPEKCQIASQSLDFLGHHIQGTTVTPQARHLQAIADFPAPHNKKQLQSFLGTCNWVREYVPRMAQLTKPLTELLQKNVKYYWGEPQQRAFQQIKKEMSSPRTLHRPDFNKRFILQVDASQIGLGAVLYQEGENNEKHIISYASAMLTKAETKYHINELEILAALFGIRKYKAYLTDKPFTLVTDSKAFYWLDKNRDSKAKLTRWSLLLQEYNFTLQHCPGRENQLADFLSRHPAPEDEHQPPDETRLLPPETRRMAILTDDSLYHQVKRAQTRANSIQQDIQKWHQLNAVAPETPGDINFLNTHLVVDHCLYKQQEGLRKLIIPSRILPQVLYHYHDGQAHPGVQETVRQIQELYHTKNLTKHASAYIKNCLECARIKTQQRQPAAAQKPHSATSPFEILSIDTLGPYPETDQGNKYIVITEDIFTKWVEARAVKKIDIQEIRQHLEGDIFPRFGVPRKIISDNAKSYTSQSYLRMCHEYGITPIYTAVYKQRENPVERRVQELKKVLRSFLHNERQRRNWDKYLNKTLAVLRTRKNVATNQTPSFALFGYEIPTPGLWQVDEYARRRREIPIATARARRRRAIRNENRFKRTQYPPPTRPPLDLQVGDMVMVKELPGPRAFNNPWSGPHPVVARRSPEIVEIDKNGSQRQYHVDQIRRAPPGNPQEFPVDDDDLGQPGDHPPPPPRFPEHIDDPGTAVHDEIITQQIPDAVPRTLQGPQPSTSQQTDKKGLPTPQRRRRRCRLVIRDAPATGEFR